MFLKLDLKLRQANEAMNSKREKRATYKRTEDNELVYRSNSTSEKVKGIPSPSKTLKESKADLSSIKVKKIEMDEENERKARPSHKRNLSQDYLSRKHFIELATDKIERSRQQVLLLKEKDPIEKLYPSLRLSSEMSMDIYTTGDMIEDMNEEELAYNIRINRIIQTTWYEHDPVLKTRQDCDNLCRERMKESNLLYDERIMENRKAAIIRKFEQTTMKWGERVDDELQFLSLPQHCMGAVLPHRYLEDLIARRKIEIQLLEQELEKRGENKGYVAHTDASYS